MSKDLSDAARVERLMAGRNKAEFARENAFPGGASMISQHISGHRPLSLEAAIAYASGLGVTLDDVSPGAADRIRAAGSRLRVAASSAQQVPPLPLAAALPVVLEAIAACPERDELRQLLPLLVTGAHGYRERITELLTGPDRTRGKLHDAA